MAERMTLAELTAQTAEDVRVLREALAAGPTRGPWHHAPHFGEWQIGSEYSVDGEARGTGRQLVAYSPRANKRATPAYAAMFEANGRFIAETSPDRITRLLDAVERERAARQQAQAELERTQEERNRSRLQGERDAARVYREKLAAVRDTLNLIHQGAQASMRLDTLGEMARAAAERIALPAAATAAQPAQSLSDALMDCVDRLGSEADSVDPRVWRHLLVYAPKAQPVAHYDGVEFSRYTIRWTNGPLPEGAALYSESVPATGATGGG